MKPRVSGFLLKKELSYLKAAIDEPKRPMTAIAAGAEMSTKLEVIELMLEKVDKLAIGRGIVFSLHFPEGSRPFCGELFG